MRRLIILTLFFIYNFQLNAQPYLDIAGTQFSMNVPDFPDDKNDVTVKYFNGQITFPHQFKDSSVLVVMVAYDNFNLDFTHRALNVHSGFMPITYQIPIKPTWKISFTAIPRFNCETTRSISSETMQYGGAFISSSRITDNFLLKWGVYYNREFFGNYWLPLVGGEWKVNSRLYIFGLIPNNLFLDYKISKAVHAGLSYKGITMSYRLEDDVFDYYRLQEGQLKMFIDFYLIKNLVLNIEAGQTVARSYGPGYLNRKYYEEPLKEGLLFKTGLYYRMWLKK